MSMIDIKKLTKKFGEFTAVDGIDLDVKKGEIFGLLGPNGAGKTTTIKMLSTTLKVTSGTAKVCGIDVEKDPDNVRKCIGIVFQDPAIDVELTGKENLDFHARMYGMGSKEREKRIEEVLEMVRLEDKADMLVIKYSGGMKRRLEIARGLMHYPKVLFLDEPTLGLDAQTRRVIWEHVKEINRKEKITIILTTHYMDEADFLCNRIAIMDHGKILTQGTPARLKSSIGADLISVKTAKKDVLEDALKKCKWVIRVNIVGDRLHITAKHGETRIPEIIKTADNLDVKVDAVELHKPTLEDVFIKYTGRNIREEHADPNGMNRIRARLRGRT